MATDLDPSNSGYITFDTNNATYNGITNTSVISGTISNVTGAVNTSIVPHQIEGDMIIAQETYDQRAIESLPDEVVKRSLCQKIAEEMYASDCIHFTKQKDIATGQIKVKAKCFVVPRGDVQLLVKAGY